MREGFFILLVACILGALTAVRYRKQIAGMIGLARALKDAKDSAVRATQSNQPASVQLVNCAGCGVWVARGKAVLRNGNYCCADCR